MSWSILSSSMFRILLRKYVRLPFFVARCLMSI